MPILDPDDTPHPILPNASRYTLRGFDYRVDGFETRLVLTLALGDDVRKLQFTQPQQLVLDERFPNAGSPAYLAISDVRARQLENVRVHVGGHDACLSFWAERVEDITRAPCL